MNTVLLYIVAIIYGVVAVGYVREGRMGMACAFGAYALANVGFILDIMETTK